ncbi:MAG: anaerobic ribonucleoside-triphosphate reductase activating protein [Candidatus Norongarragalinales archaeon]
MLIKGLQPLTLLDYPGKPSAIIFLFGCNLRCGYCQNPGLVLKSRCEYKTVSESEVFAFLDSRVGLLEGAVITGGEPCLNKDLPEFARKIKEKGFCVKLDSNGFNPSMLKKVVEEKTVDYVAMDVKAPLRKYREITRSNVDTEKIRESIEFLKQQKSVDYEFRTTVVPTLLDEGDLMEIGALVKGAKAYYLQQFENKDTLDPEFRKISPYPREFFLKIKSRLEGCSEKIGIRGLS